MKPVSISQRGKFEKHWNSQDPWFSAAGFLIACNRAMSLRIYRVWGSALCHILKPHWTGDTLVGKVILGFATKGTLESSFLL